MKETNCWWGLIKWDWYILIGSLTDVNFFYHLTTIHFPLFFLGYLLLAIIRISNISSFFFDKDCVQATRFSPLAQITDMCFKMSNCQIQFTKYEKNRPGYRWLLERKSYIYCLKKSFPFIVLFEFQLLVMNKVFIIFCSVPKN